MKNFLLFASLILLVLNCQSPQPLSIFGDALADAESINGKPEYLASPFVTAGDRLYMVGHQDGSFPDLGWHVTGEMGGIWDHPIKLMDGFTASVTQNGNTYCITEASQFTNYPFANTHEFGIDELNLGISRSQFVPDGQEAIYIEYELTNNSDQAQSFEFTFNGMTDLRPVWLGERTNMVDGQDKAAWNEAIQGIEAKDENNEWYTVFASSLKPSAHFLSAASCDFERKGLGTTASLTYKIEVPAKGQMVLPFTIAGSYTSKAKAIANLKFTQENAASLLASKVKRYGEIENIATLTIPNKKIEQAFRWTKYNTDWLIRDVEGLGRGITAGIPDYPWFFGADSEYALQGAAAIGMTDLAESTIALIDSVSNAVNNGSGKIMHEMSTNGAVFNPGNLNETPQYASLIWNVFKWTGDEAFLRAYYPTAKAGMEWLLKENDADGNLVADGYGMMEIHGLESEMIDVAAYTQKAFVDLAEMAELLGQPAEAKDYRMKATKLAAMINKDFWAAEFNSFADFIGTAKDADHLIDGAIIRADTLDKPWAVEELRATQAQVRKFNPNKKQAFVLYHNWVVNTPMEMGIADSAKAIKALETGSKYVNPFGVFVTGIDRDESAENDAGGFAKKMKIFSYTGAVMTLPTGVQAIAENNYGRPDQALAYLERMTNSFSYALPGSMYEVSPDFGMITQAWNIYSYAIPIVTQFFGIKPMAHLKEITIAPQMPTAWNTGSIENVKVGENEVSVFYKRISDSEEELTITQTDESYKILLATKAKQWNVIEGDLSSDLKNPLVLKGKRIVVKLKY
ncbi:MAG: glycogen debranching protein [Cytophagales bacterium CG12_big_fil_rev_8_21_14_0_65_40_12]|nr:MAG: glycogen debranching protein [Cytophagales bacterium CG12_big_fil_rev_8_21_14_0_65_40_12]PIW06100.1 MAG: glycogen debranching protein [Cytophagales bacterium CG17_big_fil_post_rev_8_21_14_2_50_40_13]